MKQIMMCVGILAIVAFGCNNDFSSGLEDDAGVKPQNIIGPVIPDAGKADAGICTPKCQNKDGTFKECGDDGCGGVCGVCEAKDKCHPATCGLGSKCVWTARSCKSTASKEGYCDMDDGLCHFKPIATDGGTDASEDAAVDAGTDVGNDVGPADDAGDAGTDAGVDGGCTADCTNKECGDDGCGGTCGVCDPDKDNLCRIASCTAEFACVWNNKTCADPVDPNMESYCLPQDGTCHVREKSGLDGGIDGGEADGGCTPNCATATCGADDGCGGKCDGTCPNAGEACNKTSFKCEAQFNCAPCTGMNVPDIGKFDLYCEAWSFSSNECPLQFWGEYSVGAGTSWRPPPGTAEIVCYRDTDHLIPFPPASCAGQGFNYQFGCELGTDKYGCSCDGQCAMALPPTCVYAADCPDQTGLIKACDTVNDVCLYDICFTDADCPDLAGAVKHCDVDPGKPGSHLCGYDVADGGSPTTDTGTPDAGVLPDAGDDSGSPLDAGTDAGSTDTGVPVDSGVPDDTGVPADSGVPDDTGTPTDAGTPDVGVPDTGSSTDTGVPADTGVPSDAGCISSCVNAVCGGADGCGSRCLGSCVNAGDVCNPQTLTCVTPTDGGNPGVTRSFTMQANDTCTVTAADGSVIGHVTTTSTDQHVVVPASANLVACNQQPKDCSDDPSLVCLRLPGHAQDQNPQPGCSFGAPCLVYYNPVVTDGGTPDSGVNWECVWNSDCKPAITACQAVNCVNHVCVTTPTNAGGSCEDDADPCTTDVCDAAGACQHNSIANCTMPQCGSRADCENAGTIGNLCITPRCNNSSGVGICEYDAKDCGSGTGYECYPRTGECLLKANCHQDLDCLKPNNFCTSARCVNGQCEITQLDEGAACNDGRACTTNDRCHNNQCLGTPVTCPVPKPGYYMTCEEPTAPGVDIYCAAYPL